MAKKFTLPALILREQVGFKTVNSDKRADALVVVGVVFHLGRQTSTRLCCPFSNQGKTNRHVKGTDRSIISICGRNMRTLGQRALSAWRAPPSRPEIC